MKTLGWLLVMTSVLLAGVSCAKKKHPDPKLWEITAPQAMVLGLTVTEQSDAGFRVEAVVELTNDNRVPLPLIDTHYQVRIEGVGSLSLRDDARRAVPAHGQQRMTLAASFAHDGPAPRGASWQVSGIVTYHPPGELRQIMTESMIPLPRSAFEGTGQLE